MKIKELSIIFPIYNEEARLKENLFNIIKMFKFFKSINIEVILVNDGSTDNSHIIIQNFIKLIKKNDSKKISYIYYKNNRGKGFALKKAIIATKKKWILTCDIDFSTNPLEVIKWDKLNYISSEKFCYFGSRKLKKSVIKYKFYRKFLGYIFNFIVHIMFDLRIEDTQCGFKLYNRIYSKKIFNKLYEYGYAHDVEIAVLLKKKSVKIKELPIKWIHKNKSKVNILYDGLNMLIKLLFIKLRH